MPGLQALSRYEPSWLFSDVAAGVWVAAIALPVGIAYADLAGVPAVVGMHSAIFPLLAYALFGPSRQLMPGPDAATRVIVASSLSGLVFFNADHFKERVRGVIDAGTAPVEWVVVDASAINLVDPTGVQKLIELQQELAARGIELFERRTEPAGNG